MMPTLEDFRRKLCEGGDHSFSNEEVSWLYGQVIKLDARLAASNADGRADSEMIGQFRLENQRLRIQLTGAHHRLAKIEGICEGLRVILGGG